VRVFALIGSPRKRGNGELGARYIASEAGATEFRFVRLMSKNIKDCRACYRCLEDKCPLDDDYGIILEEILRADAIIVAIPSYFFGDNASAKRFLDRGLQFYAHFKELKGKPAVGIVTAGMDYGEGYAQLALDNMLERMGLDNRGTEVLYGAMPGEIFLREENFGKLKTLASCLGGEMRIERGGDVACSLCGYPYFRFGKDGEISCLVCGSRYSSEGGVNLSRKEGTGIDLFDLQKLEEHREWLIGMKMKFLSMRNELKKVVAENFRPGEEI